MFQIKRRTLIKTLAASLCSFAIVLRVRTNSAKKQTYYNLNGWILTSQDIKKIKNKKIKISKVEFDKNAVRS